MHSKSPYFDDFIETKQNWYVIDGFPVQKDVMIFGAELFTCISYK